MELHNHIEIDGDAAGPVVAGNYNVVVDAQNGSTITVLVPGKRPAPVRRDTVRLLPRRTPEPIGRQADIARLTEAIGDGQPVQLFGVPGAGKSTLLRHAARTFAPGPDGVVFVSATYREVGDIAQQVFEACYEAAGFAPSSTELRELMAGVAVTVYVDNAEFDREQLRELTDAIPDAIFVFASEQRSLDGEGTVLELTGLDGEAGLSLLAKELRRPLRESEQVTAAELCSATGGLPLLLLRAAGVARFGSDGEGALPAPGAVAEIIPLLLDQLDESAAAVLHLLASLDDAELAVSHIGALTEVPDAEAVCERLTELGLTASAEHGYRCASDAVPVIRDRNDEPFSPQRLCDYLTEWVKRTTTTAAEVAEQVRAIDKAAELAEFADKPELAVQLARAASPLLARSLRFDAWGHAIGRGWLAAQKAGDKPARAYFTHEEGIRSLLTGKGVLSAVLLGEALLMWKELSDLQGVTAALHAQQYAPHLGTPLSQLSSASAPGHLTSQLTPQLASNQMAANHMTTLSQPTLNHPAATVSHANYPPHTVHHAPVHHAPAHHAPVHHPAHHVAHHPAHHVEHAAHHPHHTGHAPTHPGHRATHAGHGAGHAGHAASHAGHAAAHAGHAAGHVAKTGLSLGVKLGIVAASAVVVGGISVGINNLSNDSSTSDDTSTSQTGLAGNWVDDQGTLYTFTADGGDSYSVPDCDGSTFTITSTGDTYSGQGPLHDASGGGCGSRIGYVDVTVTLSADQSTAEVNVSMPSDETGPNGETLTCESCGTRSLTRQ